MVVDGVGIEGEKRVPQPDRSARFSAHLHSIRERKERKVSPRPRGRAKLMTYYTVLTCKPLTTDLDVCRNSSQRQVSDPGLWK